MAKDDEPAHARVERFVRENWTALAGFAWRGYKKQGRGGLLIHWTAVATWEAKQPVTLVPHYITYTEVSRFGHLIESYDPARAMVVAVVGADTETKDAPATNGAPAMKFIRADASFRAWVFDGDPPPPEAMASEGN